MLVEHIQKNFLTLSYGCFWVITTKERLTAFHNERQYLVRVFRADKNQNIIDIDEIEWKRFDYLEDAADYHNHLADLLYKAQPLR